LRDNIYTLIFTHDPLVRILEAGTPTQSFPGLLQTCHQIYSEAHPMLLRSLTFVISTAGALDATQRWLEHKNLKDVRSIAVTSFSLLRTFPPGQRCMLWVRDECMPLPPAMRVGPKIYITGSDAPSASHATVPKAMRVLLMLSGLRHLEIGIHVKFHTDAMDKAQRGERHYYDLYSLTAITTLRSLILSCDSRMIARMYREVCKKKEEERSSRQVRLKEVLEDAWGLRSWTEDAFREKGLDVIVRCVWLSAELHLRSV
jgi:hypothetical protein